MVFRDRYPDLIAAGVETEEQLAFSAERVPGRPRLPLRADVASP